MTTLKPMLRCSATDNPCGSDTWLDGMCCSCVNCRKWVMKQWGNAIKIIGEKDKRIAELERKYALVLRVSGLTDRVVVAAIHLEGEE